MKKLFALILALCMMITSVFCLNSCFLGIGNESNSDQIGNNGNIDSGTDEGNKNENYVPNCSEGDHLDEDKNEICDLCSSSVIVVIDFYVFNDLHGKFCDSDTQPGVDEIGTYFDMMQNSDDYMVIMSSGDMWQGTAESNLTRGQLVTEWMNEMDFVSMTLGNHEFDWGEEAIRNNHDIAEFPFLAINIYSVSTGKLADYCTPSVMIQRGDVKIGIIGAIGDCYSSISSDMVSDVRFKVGNELTALVKAESKKLRDAGADIIVYSLHDGYTSSKSGTNMVGSSALSSYYDTVLSDGYVDLVFEAHTHQYYTLIDNSGVYHLQGGGENYGLSHVEVSVNSANGSSKVLDAGIVGSATYGKLDDDAETEAIEDKYSDIIDYAYTELVIVSKTYSDSEVEDYVASLYLEAGIEKWGEDYDIVLGGGFLKTRSPYDLAAGYTTYADILSLLPFDNQIVLCSISGANLSNRFIYTTNSDYHNAYSQYGNSVKNNINSAETYYVVVDTYTALYAANRLTIIDYYDSTTFARDLFAEKVKAGEFEVKHEGYTLTSIADALRIGQSLGNNVATAESYYIKGTITSVDNATYGNVYIVDESGDVIYVYGLYDIFGNRYNSMSDKPVVGDEVVLYSVVYKFVYGNTVTIELKNAVVIEKN